MCGICGIINRDGQPVEKGVLQRLSSVLRHRGPDDEGYHYEPGVGLGFRRLSIIDLSGGRQPMTNEDQTVWVVFNGEIYNFKELRLLLQTYGHVFRTASDTEVIVHGFEQWGEDVVHHLNGMFAFAAWDSRSRRLLLARDRLGIKPLFYSLIDGSLAFASEIKSLLLWPQLDPAINDRGVFEYFSQHFVPGSETFYSHIHKLQPAEMLRLADGDVRLRKYWHPQVIPNAKQSVADAVDELRQRLLAAVKMQLVADVPLGVFLSGGIDSSAVTAAMGQAGVQEIRSFNIGFDVKRYDETDFALQVSQHLGTRHESFRLNEWPTSILPKLLWHLDEPMADATIIPTYILSLMTRRHVTVALSGEGGDELFAGYTHYQGMKLNRLLQFFPVSWRRLGVAWLKHLPYGGSARTGYFLDRLARIVSSSFFPLFEGYTRKVAFFSPEEQQLLFSPAFQEKMAHFPYLSAVRRIPQDHPELDAVSQANLTDLLIYLPEDMLVKVDRMSMAGSLEVRVPILDHTLVEFALSLPFSFKMKGLETKYILRRALQPWLPASILQRRKRGFNPPLEFWLQKGLVEYAREQEMMATVAACGYFNPDYIQLLIDAHVSGRRNYARQLWSILVFALWWRRIRGKGECPV